MSTPIPRFAERMTAMKPSLVRELLKRAQGTDIISFAGGLPNPRFFPSKQLISATETVLQNDSADSLQYSMSEGYRPLRAWIAERYQQRFGVNIPVDNILIMSGSQQALDLIGKIFLDPNDIVVIEKPGYQGMIHALKLYQPKFIGVALNDDGLDATQLDRVLSETQAKLVITCPNFQNPSGISYTSKNREAVSAVIRKHRVALIEDDPYSELSFEGTVAPSFITHLENQCIALGSFSKIVAPGMRLGWVVASDEILHKLIIAKQGADFHTSQFSQRALHQYLVSQPLDDHIQRIRKAYSEQCEAMLGALEKYFPPDVRYTRPVGGMFVWLTLPSDDVDTMAMLNDAIDAGVTFLPGAVFYTDGGGKNQIRLSYSMCDPTMIDEGVKRLAQVVIKHLDGVSFISPSTPDRANALRPS
jgi:2-aminoadipate transaminase